MGYKSGIDTVLMGWSSFGCDSHWHKGPFIYYEASGSWKVGHPKNTLKKGHHKNTCNGRTHLVEEELHTNIHLSLI